MSQTSKRPGRHKNKGLVCKTTVCATSREPNLDCRRLHEQSYQQQSSAWCVYKVTRQVPRQARLRGLVPKDAVGLYMLLGCEAKQRQACTGLGQFACRPTLMLCCYKPHLMVSKGLYTREAETSRQMKELRTTGYCRTTTHDPQLLSLSGA